MGRLLRRAAVVGAVIGVVGGAAWVLLTSDLALGRGLEALTQARAEAEQTAEDLQAQLGEAVQELRAVEADLGRAEAEVTKLRADYARLERQKVRTEVETRRVERTPRSCIRALDIASEGFRIAAQYPPMVAEAAQAGATFDTGALNSITSQMEDLNNQLNALQPELAEASQDCGSRS